MGGLKNTTSLVDLSKGSPLHGARQCIKGGSWTGLQASVDI